MTPTEALTQLTQVNNLTAIAATALQEALDQNEQLKADNTRLREQLHEQQTQGLTTAVTRAQAAATTHPESDSDTNDG